MLDRQTMMPMLERTIPQSYPTNQKLFPRTHTQCISPSKNDTNLIHTTLITQTQDRTCIVRNYMHILVAAP